MGRVSDCADPSYTTKHDCLAAGQVWVTPSGHYDDVVNSMIVFFEISTLENWT
jgi:hypothetical protein